MSDTEEPQPKVPKLEMSSEFLEEGLEEGQEEWLTEDVLTDDDQIAAAKNASKTEPVTEKKTKDTDIENALNNFDSNNSETKTSTNPESTSIKVEAEDNTEEAHTDDGNNTDELLSMLQDGDKKKNKKLRTMKIQKESSQDNSSDDEYVFDSSKVSRIVSGARKAVPEESDIDESSGEETTVHKMFDVRDVSNKGKNKPVITDQQKLAIKNYIEKRENMQKNAKQMHTLKTYQRSKPTVKKEATSKSSMSNSEKVDIYGSRPSPMSKPGPSDGEAKKDSDKKHDSAEGSKPKNQNIMEPEKMDEEVPSDEDSLDDDESYYEEDMPTSDSDDAEDWFTLDIRAERAGEFIPMLGSNARRILTEEKRRVGVRLEELRKSVSALTESAKDQAEQIREAANTLSELEAMIKAA